MRPGGSSSPSSSGSRFADLARSARAGLLGGAILLALVALASSGLDPVRIVNPQRFEFPPRTELGVWLPPVLGSPESAGFGELAKELRSTPDVVQRLRLLCGGLHSRMPYAPSFPKRREAVLPAAPEAAEQVLATWQAGQHADRLSVAWLALRLAVAGGLDARLIVADDGSLISPAGCAGIEVWYPTQHSWIAVDPTAGLLFNRPGGFLSFLELAQCLAEGRTAEVTPLVDRVAPSRFGSRAFEYSQSLHNVWLPSISVSEAGASKRTWLLAASPGACSWPWWLRSTGAKLDSRLSSYWTGPPAGLWGKLALGALLLHVLLVLGAGAGKPREEQARLVAEDAGRVVAAVAAGVEPLVALARRARAAAREHGWELVRRSLRPRDDGRPAPPAGRVKLGSFLFLAALALTAAAFQSLALRPICEEDAYISFRVARNLATGGGFSFNPGEPGVEGFSNLLWILLLSAGYRLWPDLPHLSLALGWAFLAAHLLLVCWLALRMGRLAWLPVLLLATNLSFVGCATSGLETAMVAFLVTAAVCGWRREAPGRPSWGVMLACALVCMSRPEGVTLFAAISLGREVLDDAAGAGWRRRWYLPFGLFLTAYTLARFLLFGAVVPHVYQGRTLAQHGPLLDRLGQGAEYLAATFLANPALALGLAGLVLVARNAAGFRLAAVVAVHVAVVLTVGGDMEYFGYSRFLMPVAALLAISGQLAAQRLSEESRWPVAVAGLALAAVLAGNSHTSLRPQFVAAWQPVPLARCLTAGPGAFLAAGRSGMAHLASGDFDGTRGSFDGQVARHLVAHLPHSAELVCPSAGRMAYLWPGPFLDHLGLVTQKPAILPPGQRGPPARRYYLTFPALLPPDLQSLRRAGYRLVWAYVAVLQKRETHLPSYVLLAPPPEGQLALTPDLFETDWQDLRWPDLPRSQVVLCLENPKDRPVFDGVAGTQDAGQFPLLPPPVRRWVERR